MSQQGRDGASAEAIAHPNIALAKYWGKRTFGHNLPAVPSLSVTLEGMATRTRVTLDASLEADVFLLAGNVAPDAAKVRVVGLLDRVRARAGSKLRARVESANDFPTSSGLASSASAFAALATAATAAYGVDATDDERSDLARKTSVSAARSVLGGFVELRAGIEGDETLAATQLAPPDAWAVAIVVAATTRAAKETASTEGMLHTVRTSPYHAAWVDYAPRVFAQAKAALAARDVEAMGDAIEASSFAMHADAIAARPSVVYWNAGTMAALAEVRALRKGGLGVWATMDAGPHVKVFTRSADAERVKDAMRAVAGVVDAFVAKPGAGSRVVSGSSERPQEAPGDAR
jgi:diphosphomevalonate decarboxylase